MQSWTTQQVFLQILMVTLILGLASALLMRSKGISLSKTFTRSGRYALLKLGLRRETLREKWLIALRSGEYPQTQDSLRTVNGFCCLGVLCDVYVKEYPESTGWQNAGGHFFQFQGMDGIPPSRISKYAGINNDDVTHLTNMNDSGYSFKDIADWIENAPARA